MQLRKVRRLIQDEDRLRIEMEGKCKSFKEEDARKDAIRCQLMLSKPFPGQTQRVSITIICGVSVVPSIIIAVLRIHHQFERLVRGVRWTGRG